MRLNICGLELSLMLITGVLNCLLSVYRVANTWERSLLHFMGADRSSSIILGCGRAHLLVHGVAHSDRNTHFAARMLSSLQFLIKVDRSVRVRWLLPLHRYPLLHRELARMLRWGIVLAGKHLACMVISLKAVLGSSIVRVVATDETWQGPSLWLLLLIHHLQQFYLIQIHSMRFLI